MSQKQTRSIDVLAEQLLDARARFTGYIRARVGDSELADDIFQEGLLRAVRAAPELRDDERLVPWFQAILRNAIVDVHRHRSVERRHLLPLGDTDPGMDPDEDDEAMACACFEALLPTLKADYADLIRAMDLRGDSTEVTAARLGITMNNLKVRRHRARQALKSRLEETCRTCAQHHCLDCTCRGE